MAEEIKIVVREEKQGPDVLKQTAEDARKLKEQQGSGPAGAGGGGGAAPAAGGGGGGGSSATEQAVMKAAGGGHGGMSTTRMTGDFLDSTTGQTGWVYRAQMLKNMGARMGAVALAVAAAYEGLDYYFQNKDKDEEVANHLGAMRSSGARRARLAETFRGSGAASRSEEDALAEQIAAKNDELPEIARRNRHAWYNPLRWWNAATGNEDMTRQGDREKAENYTQQQQLNEERAKAVENRRRKYDEETGAHDRATAARLSGDERAAKEIEYQALWTQGQNRRLREGADLWQAQEGASLDVAMAQRQQAMAVASRMVDARTGAAGTARAAMIAGGLFGSHHAGGDNGLGWLHSAHHAAGDGGNSIRIGLAIHKSLEKIHGQAERHKAELSSYGEHV